MNGVYECTWEQNADEAQAAHERTGQLLDQFADLTFPLAELAHLVEPCEHGYMTDACTDCNVTQPLDFLDYGEDISTWEVVVETDTDEVDA